MTGLCSIDLLKNASKIKHEKEENIVLIDNEYFNLCLNVIEKELKKQRERIIEVELTNCRMFSREIENIKKLKVLEIIKKRITWIS